MNNNAGRATPCARAPLPGADLGRQTFMRLQLIGRCSIRKDAERTKGENRQEAKHGQIFPRPRLRKDRQVPWDCHFANSRPLTPAGFSVYAGQNKLAAVDGKATGRGWLMRALGCGWRALFHDSQVAVTAWDDTPASHPPRAQSTQQFHQGAMLVPPLRGNGRIESRNRVELFSWRKMTALGFRRR